MTFAKKAIRFNRQLRYTGDPLPPGIRMMNPFTESEQPLLIAEKFYQKYYNDDKPRHLILGINPGRFGAGLTGIPFTDPKRLESECQIGYAGKQTHEPSSVFIYEMIHAYGGAKAFYGDFYINSICPLGFTSVDAKGKEKNYNYYDSRELRAALRSFIIGNIRSLIAMGVSREICFCFGTGENEKFLTKLNQEFSFFGKIISLEHPRYIMQYKHIEKNDYIHKYLDAFHLINR
jgi:Uracil DNA glycosylase superfamily